MNQSLEQLSLRTNAIGGIGMSGVSALAEALKTNTSLLTLRLSSNFLNNMHAVILETLFDGNQNLTKLSYVQYIGRFVVPSCMLYVFFHKHVIHI